MAKVSKRERIIALLKTDASPAQIAKKVDVSVNYVYMVRYSLNKAKGKKKTAKAKSNGHAAAPAEASPVTGLPTVANMQLDEAIEKLTAKLAELQAFKDSLANALSAL